MNEPMIMKTRRLPLFALSVVLLIIPRSSPAAESQSDQVELARQLLTPDPSERSKALEAIRSMEARNIGPELRKALVALLDEQTTLVRNAMASGGPVEHVLNPEFHARVCQTVTELRDPFTIPALARGLGSCGWLVYRYLAAFGDQAAPAILAVVRSPRSSHDAVNEGLIALRLMVEQASERPLSAATFEGIRAVAQQRLTGRQYFTTLWWAIDLAVVLGDPALRGIVASIASDRQAVLARGVEKPELIEKTQQRAADRLAGVPPLPRQ